MEIKIEQNLNVEKKDHIILENYTDYAEHIIKMGAGFFKNYLFKKLHVGYAYFLFNKETIISFTEEFEAIKMHFILSGSSKITTNNKTYKFEVKQHNISYQPKTQNKWQWQSSNQLQLFEITIKLDFFEKYTPKDNPYFKLFMEAIDKKEINRLSQQNLVITQEMETIINNITQCKREGYYKEMYIESKIIELLLLQIEQLCCNKCQINYNIKEADIQKMNKVKDIILKDVKQNFLLKRLANEVGTNEFTLKKNFKTVFGTSVFKYINEAKMQKAKSLIAEQNLTITHIAELVGYKNATHFTTAFKKKYGIVPSKFTSK